MRAIRLTLAVLVTAGVLAFSGAGPAFACSCAIANTKEYVGYADVVVTGTLVDMVDPPQKPIMSSGDPITYTVEVDQTFKGDASSEVEFTSAMSGASCGLEGMKVDRRYAFFLNADGDGLTATLCGGTTSANHALKGEIARWTGPPVTSPHTSAPGPSPVSTRLDDDAPAQWAFPLWVMVTAGGGGIVVLVAVATLLWRRRER